MIGGFIIKEDAEVCLNENELTPEVEISPAVETETKANASSEDCDKYCQDLKILALKIAELEDKIVKLEVKLNSPVEKQKKRGKKGKGKFKDKMIDKSKSRSKKKDKDKDTLI